MKSNGPLRPEFLLAWAGDNPLRMNW
jgi:hypothetical protein